MNTKQISIGLALVTTLFSSTLFGQKTMETSAAVEYKAYENLFGKMMMGEGDAASLKRAIMKAKSSIDQASVHPDTEKSQKTLFYKGQIYFALTLVSGMNNDSVVDGVKLADIGAVSMKAYKDSWAIGKKMQPDIKEAIEEKIQLFSMGTEALTKDKKYLELAGLSDAVTELRSVTGEIDTLSIYNAGLYYSRAEKLDSAASRFLQAARFGYDAANCYALASDYYRKAGNKVKSNEATQEGLKKFPGNTALLTGQINAMIEAGDNKGADEALTQAVAADPKNKVLHYNIGTICMNLGQNDRATESLKKAIELDPNYLDAHYQLGAHLSNLANELRKKASGMDPDDLKAQSDSKAMIEKANGYYNEAVFHLEKVVAVDSNDRALLQVLSQIYRKLGNQAKSDEYKARMNAVK